MKFGRINVCLFLLALAVFSEAKHESYGAVRDGQFPFTAVVITGGRNICGASIIHERWILTAAHCLEGDRAKTHIVVGAAASLGSGITYEIEQLYKHPNFTRIPENNSLEYIVNDIGLIRLASSLEFNGKVQPIELATDNDGSYENSMATLAGWGMDKRRQGVYHHLHHIKVRVLPHSECRSVWTYADKHICTSTQEKQEICSDDSGSPLVADDGVQIGIASTSDSYCESFKRDLYTKVASFVPWIESIINKHGDVLQDS